MGIRKTWFRRPAGSSHARIAETAAVPFHALPALHAKMQPRLQHETRGYWRTLSGVVARTWQ